MSEKSLYERLGGYDAVAAVANDLLPSLQGDAALSRFWNHRGEDGVVAVIESTRSEIVEV